MRKQQKPDNEIVRSLINLRDELIDKDIDKYHEIFFKINSCLYDQYPVHPRKEQNA